MKQGIYKVLENTPLTDTVWRMALEGDTSAFTAPGQFVNMKVPGFYLRRPISVCDWDETTLVILYKVVGKGTDALTQIPLDADLDLLAGLGNGYDTSVSGDRPVLIGGGVGIPPLYRLCKQLVEEGKAPEVILGFNTADERFLYEEFMALLARTSGSIHVTTVDGSMGTKGFVTDVLKDLDYTYFYTCGPGPMFQAIEAAAVTSGQYSFEERMGCGFGACMGCSIETKRGAKRVCREGPVFRREDILW
ncbi:MAG: dihydroorotate dehydrogenase electron transfer subunit [Clostridia bacterium]|nr:dihydroorotate dehydrogenase electron transfer subunit [Clostridia bacterium]